MNIQNKRPGVVFSQKEKQKDNNELISKYDKRINDMLHKIEFTDATPNQAFKMYMKLQGFLDGKVTKLKRSDEDGNRPRNKR